MAFFPELEFCFVCRYHQSMGIKKDSMQPDGALLSEGTSKDHENPVLGRLLANQSAFQAFLCSRMRDDSLADDLLQQSLIRAVQSQHSLRNDASVVAWFYQILRHTIIHYYRSKDAEDRRNEAFLQELTVSGDDKEPPIDEAKPMVCACLHRLLPNLRSNYAGRHRG